MIAPACNQSLIVLRMACAAISDTAAGVSFRHNYKIVDIVGSSWSPTSPLDGWASSSSWSPSTSHCVRNRMMDAGRCVPVFFIKATLQRFMRAARGEKLKGANDQTRVRCGFSPHARLPRIPWKPAAAAGGGRGRWLTRFLCCWFKGIVAFPSTKRPLD